MSPSFCSEFGLCGGWWVFPDETKIGKEMRTTRVRPGNTHRRRIGWVLPVFSVSVHPSSCLFDSPQLFSLLPRVIFYLHIFILRVPCFGYEFPHCSTGLEALQACLAGLQHSDTSLPGRSRHTHQYTYSKAPPKCSHHHHLLSQTSIPRQARRICLVRPPLPLEMEMHDPKSSLGLPSTSSSTGDGKDPSGP